MHRERSPTLLVRKNFSENSTYSSIVYLYLQRVCYWQCRDGAGWLPLQDGGCRVAAAGGCVFAEAYFRKNAFSQECIFTKLHFRKSALPESAFSQKCMFTKHKQNVFAKVYLRRNALSQQCIFAKEKKYILQKCIFAKVYFRRKHFRNNASSQKCPRKNAFLQK